MAAIKSVQQSVHIRVDKAGLKRLFCVIATGIPGQFNPTPE